MSGGVFLEVLSICYNRTGAFLVAGIYLIEYDRGFVLKINKYYTDERQHNPHVNTMGSQSGQTIW